jgi:DNA-directed RNA polymerase specialized sigma24 family protein
MPGREKTIEDQRADIVRRMSGPGARRIELLQELAELDRTIRPLVIKASGLGLTTRRIGEIVGLTGSAVCKWVAKAMNQ